MIAKKNRGADLEKRRFAFFQIGLLLAGSLVLVAFEYTTAEELEKATHISQEEGIISCPLPVEINVVHEEQKEVRRQFVNLNDIDSLNIVDEFTASENEFVQTGETVTIEGGPEEGEVFSMILKEDNSDSVHLYTSIPPEFPGGESAMYKWMAEQVKYPEIQAQMGVQGVVYTEFIVNKDGSIEKVKVLRSVDKALDGEAVRVIKKMPPWKPGEFKGKKVRTKFTLPISFVVAV